MTDPQLEFDYSDAYELLKFRDFARLDSDLWMYNFPDNKRTIIVRKMPETDRWEVVFGEGQTQYPNTSSLIQGLCVFNDANDTE